MIGAFALSNNLFIIAIGLGVGAMFVRSLTIMLVERETLACYRYLEHGAFYAIIALALMMFVNAVTHISEVVTGLIGAGFIVTAFLDSIRYNRRALGIESGGSPGSNPRAEFVNLQARQIRPESPAREPSVQSRPE